MNLAFWKERLSGRTFKDVMKCTIRNWLVHNILIERRQRVSTYSQEFALNFTKTRALTAIQFGKNVIYFVNCDLAKFKWHWPRYVSFGGYNTRMVVMFRYHWPKNIIVPIVNPYRIIKTDVISDIYEIFVENVCNCDQIIYNLRSFSYNMILLIFWFLLPQNGFIVSQSFDFGTTVT